MKIGINDWVVRPKMDGEYEIFHYRNLIQRNYRRSIYNYSDLETAIVEAMMHTANTCGKAVHVYNDAGKITFSVPIGGR